MLVASALPLNILMAILDVGSVAPSKQILALMTFDLRHIDGSFGDLARICKLVSKVEVFIAEVEDYVLDKMQMPLALLTIRMIPESSGRRCLQCHALPMAPFLEVAELTIYVIKGVAARLGFLRSWDSQLLVCAQDTAEC